MARDLAFPAAGDGAAEPGQRGPQIIVADGFEAGVDLGLLGRVERPRGRRQ